jgi:hypothetical protein
MLGATLNTVSTSSGLRPHVSRRPTTMTASFFWSSSPGTCVPHADERLERRLAASRSGGYADLHLRREIRVDCPLLVAVHPAGSREREDAASAAAYSVVSAGGSIAWGPLGSFGVESRAR